MKILIVNPNTTSSMTKSIDQTVQALVSDEVIAKTINPDFGPESIEGFYDEAFSVPGLLQELLHYKNWDGFVIACFDDTGLDAARCLVSGPVIGIGEAAFHMASFVAHKFSVITTLSRSIPAIENNIYKYGLDRRCASIHACEFGVLDLKVDLNEAKKSISREIVKARDTKGADAIILGCAGMTDLTRELSDEHGIPVVDGVAAAIELITSLVKMGLKTGKINGYAFPRPKTYLGQFEAFAPKKHRM